NGSTSYFIVNGTCECKDYPKAPSGWCKHRLAYGIYKRVSALMKATVEPYENTESQRVEIPLPEAPASVNVRLMLRGREVQIKLRDANEHHLLERLETLLERFPVQETQQEGWCRKHHLKMKENHKNGQTWYSHKVGSTWCHGK